MSSTNEKLAMPENVGDGERISCLVLIDIDPGQEETSNSGSSVESQSLVANKCLSMGRRSMTKKSCSFGEGVDDAVSEDSGEFLERLASGTAGPEHPVGSHANAMTVSGTAHLRIVTINPP
jgi:hypothetical protein